MLGKLQMAEYRAGTSRLALPELVLVQNRDGSLGFGGRALLTGPLPGGMARNLALPLDGIWSPRGGLAVWRRCIDLRFDELGYANLTLTNRQLLVCPGPGGAILRADAGGVKLAAGAPSLNVAGRLGTTPIRIASGAVGFAMPGSLSARSLNITLGPAANATDVPDQQPLGARRPGYRRAVRRYRSADRRGAARYRRCWRELALRERRADPDRRRVPAGRPRGSKTASNR